MEEGSGLLIPKGILTAKAAAGFLSESFDRHLTCNLFFLDGAALQIPEYYKVR